MKDPKWVQDVDELAGLVADGETIGPSGFHFVRAPMAQLGALARAQRKNLTYVSWGGGLPLEFLLSADAVRKLVFCFSSFDIFGLAPRFRKALEERSIEVEERTALAFMNGLRAGVEQVPYEIFQAPVESDLKNGFSDVPPTITDATAAPIGAATALSVDAFLLHAQRADESGNVEISGARGLDLPALFGARKVLVTVEERVPDGTIGKTPRSFVVPRSFVTAVALAPGGAWPTSCLPYYTTDYRSLQRIAAVPTGQEIPPEALDPPEERLRAVTTIGSHQPAEVVKALREHQNDRDSNGSPYGGHDDFTVDELMVSVIARTVDDKSICSVGSVSPLATIGYLLAKQLWAPRAMIISFNGGYVDIASKPMSIITAELLDYHSARSHIGGDDSYHWYYQRGLISHEVVSAAQVDRRAATNTVSIQRTGGGEVRLPGQGGMADVADMHQNFFIYLPRHSQRTLVEKVHFVSARRAFHGLQRLDFGYHEGRVLVLTNLGLFEFDPDLDELVLTHLHPGVSLEDLREQTGFDPRIADDLAETPAPTSEELVAIRSELDPLGVRRLEFVSSADRAALIEELLTAEETALDAVGVQSP